ncbi:MAG: AraC family transcriptional regulator [Verrucomicrobia bacterium]|nr:MAG: AraC family transcriptional regulator [Verrucomicrobiota bacterium]
MSNQFKVSNLWAQRLQEHHISLPAVLRRAGLPAGFFQQEKIYVTTAELFALWRAVGETSGDPAIGLKLGAEARLERHDPAAIAAVCSRSFRDAVQRIAFYKQLTCPEEIRIRTGRDETSVEFAFIQAEGDEPDVLVDICLSWIFSIGHRGTDGSVKPLRVELIRPVRHRELLEAHFGSRVRFKAERNVLVFRSSDLDRPFTTHNEELLKIVGAQLDAEVQARNASSDIGEQVKQTLRHSLAGRRPTLQNVAKDLHLSVRTLQRRLTDAGITFQQLVEETRRDLAHHYLKQSAVELNETAYLLGYEDANSFFRAFHVWEGTSPGEWRTRHRTPEMSACQGTQHHRRGI